jgi:mannan endo-1,4-beta-mannosidase
MVRFCGRVAALVLLIAASGWAQSSGEPVTPNASPEARALLRAINWISGRNILSGQQNPAEMPARHSDIAHLATGKWAAIWGAEFGIIAEDNENMVAEVQQQFDSGSIIELTWQGGNPIDEKSTESKLNDEQWRELLTDGSTLEKHWEAQVDLIAPYLKQMRDARIPVLWRPYPESNGNSFWYSGRAGQNGSAALYRRLFDRLAAHHGLNNLIWVWCAAAPGASASAPEEFYPGTQYYDVLSASGTPTLSAEQRMIRLGAGKPIALDDVDTVPAPEVLDQQPFWSWFYDQGSSEPCV